MTELNVLRLNVPQYNILNWLAILAENRTYWQNASIAEEAKEYIRNHFLIDIAPYDVIIGYRADDSYFSFAQDFVANVISLEKLSEAMRLGKRKAGLSGIIYVGYYERRNGKWRCTLISMII